MSKKVHIGLIGTSWWVDLMYVPSLMSHPSAHVVGVCGRNATRTGEVAHKFGRAEVFTDHRQLINSGRLDAIIVASPDDLHHEMTMAAIDAGLHVLCEKPLACNAADARQMHERAEAAGLKHMVLFTWRWQPHWRYLKHLVDGGFIGRCHHAEFQFLGGFALDAGYKWRFDGARANGITGDLGSHMIDFACWYLGAVTEVTADLSTFIDQSETATPPPAPANDAGLLTLRIRQRSARPDHCLGGQPARRRRRLYRRCAARLGRHHREPPHLFRRRRRRVDPRRSGGQIVLRQSRGAGCLP